MSEVRLEVQRMHWLNSDMQDPLRRLSLHLPSSASSGGGDAQVAGRDVQQTEAGTTRPTKKPRAEESKTAPSTSDHGASEAWTRVTTMRSPSASAGRAAGGGPCADDNRTVVVPGLPRQVMRSKLPELPKPVLDRFGNRFERFAGKPASAAAALAMKTRDEAVAMVNEFAPVTTAAIFGEGKAPVPLWVMLSSPPWLLEWNGFTMGVNEVLKADPRVTDVTVHKRMGGNFKTAEILVQVGGSLRRSRRTTPAVATSSGRPWSWRKRTRPGRRCLTQAQPPLRSRY